MIYFTIGLVHRFEDVANDWIDSHPVRRGRRHLSLTTLRDVERLYDIVCQKLDSLYREIQPGRFMNPYNEGYYGEIEDNDYYISNEYEQFESMKTAYGLKDDIQKLMHAYALVCLVKENRAYPARAVINYLSRRYDGLFGERINENRSSTSLTYGMNEEEALTTLLIRVDGFSKARLKALMELSPRSLKTTCQQKLQENICDSSRLHLRNLKNVFKNYFDVVASCDEDCKIPVGRPGHDLCKSLALFLGFSSWEEMVNDTHYMEEKTEPLSSTLTVTSLAADELSSLRKGDRVRIRLTDSKYGNDAYKVVEVILTALGENQDDSGFSVDEVSSEIAGFRKGINVIFSNFDYDSPVEFSTEEAFLSSGDFVLHSIETSNGGADGDSMLRLRDDLREYLFSEANIDIGKGGLSAAASFMTEKGYTINRKQLGRFMGIASYYNNGRSSDPSKAKKDLVCQFLGYSSYEDYVYRNFDNKAYDVPRTAKEHPLSEFEYGKMYRVTYKPMHIIDFEAVKDGKGMTSLKVVSIAGSKKLRKGDLCTFDRIRRGEPLRMHVAGRNIYQSATPIEKILEKCDSRWKNMDI